MAWIIMGIDECGSEFNAGDRSYPTEGDANRNLSEVRESYPEARRIWVEMLQDKEYWLEELRRNPDSIDEPLTH
jgi:ABC-type ATPase with predicted acetyltransferase domain